ncbi:FAD-binding oxidoreductase [Pseudoduganella albidiflava]|uniref:D-lactate dehydrogenase (cytochrome) n=1 Tax=Pseudoduganella albidiflava TaxID=321983 RepID=A0A411WY45_9BURK|nr:FAD-binding oxidoreductase [Pseudoduganella albidiflava]QBI01629.1 FAD-binding oxidoreductase [Pseudoduganella albidiflava]GGY34113.1 4-cresol dehydrogenase [Pseudoduganella albidiflava]
MAAAEEALLGWRRLLGPDRVLQDPATLARFAASTSSWSTWPLAILQPHSTAEVTQLVRTATRHRIPLYPISAGRNWGYGDACALSDGHAVVDLSGMNRILEADATLAYVVIEPGVTQQQLSRYLLEHDLPLWMDCTGAGPDTSLMGNILERGFGHSPYGNRFQNVASMELVLADGDVVRTGFGHYAASINHRVYPYGVGPYVDGLFTQSNMGIVTSLGLWLMPKTEALNHFLCMVREHDDIAPIIDALRPLRLDGTLRSILHIGNDLRVISGGTTFPRELTGGKVPLPEDVRLKLRAGAGVGAWTVSGALYGSNDQVAAARRAVRRALAPTRAHIQFLDERKLDLAATAARMLGNTGAGKRLAAKVALGRSLFDMNRGIPNGRFLAGAYWRRRGGLPAGFPANANPALDNCGMLWVSPVLPMRGADLLRVHALAEPIFRTHGFDLFVTFSMINERALGGVLTVAYDAEDPAEVERARRCYRQVFETMMSAGYIPYRVGLQSMADLDNGDDAYWRMIGRIKAALDPANVIAPGRYSARMPPRE